MQRRKQGYTLVEMIMATFVGSILMAGAYQGFNIISRQYDAVRSGGDMQDGGKAALDVLAADMRKAGRLAFDGAGQAPGGSIAAPLTVTANPDAPCCDTLTIIYDRDTATRIEVRYYVQERAFPEPRYALYTDKTIIDNGVRTPEYSASYVADYIEAFHVNIRDTNNAGDPLLADAELVIRAKNKGFFEDGFTTPAYAAMPEYTAESDAFTRKFFIKTVLLRNLERL